MAIIITYRQFGCLLDDVYMHKRIHSSLGYLTPSRIRGTVAEGASPGPRFELKIAPKVSNLRGSVYGISHSSGLRHGQGDQAGRGCQRQRDRAQEGPGSGHRPGGQPHHRLHLGGAGTPRRASAAAGGGGGVQSGVRPTRRSGRADLPLPGHGHGPHDPPTGLPSPLGGRRRAFKDFLHPSRRAMSFGRIRLRPQT